MSDGSFSDVMRLAIDEARRAIDHDDVPIGALVLGPDGSAVALDHNRREELNDPTAHAEILALRAAANTLGDYRLGGTTLYVTLEPCPMCAAARVHARVARLVFGAWDPRQGAAGSVFNLVTARAMNHQVDCFGGVLADECGTLLKRFFESRR